MTPEGAAYALIGTNGAGKTTTLKVLMNIVSPTRGTAQLLGIDTQRFSAVRCAASALTPFRCMRYLPA